MNINVNNDERYRMHRIGRSYIDQGKKYQSVILKFKSWDTRQKVFNARPKKFIKGKKKPVQPNFSVALDLTNRRYNLLLKARELCDKVDSILYAFVDRNCSLAIKFNDNKITHFNSDDELDHLLAIGD